MADLSFSVGLDDKSYNAALRRMEGNTKKAAGGISGAFSKGGRGGMAGYLSNVTAGVDNLNNFAKQAPRIVRTAGAVLIAKMAYDQLTKSAAAFAKGNDDAARALNGTSRAAASFASSAGPAAYGIMLGIRSRLDELAQSAEGAMTSLSKFGLDLFGGAGTYDGTKKAVNEGKALQKHGDVLKAAKLDRDRLRPLIGAGIEDARLGQLSVYDQPDAKYRAGIARSELEEKRAIANVLRETSKLSAIEKEQLGVTRLITEINKRGSFERSAMAIAEQDRLAEVDVAAGKMAQDAAEQAAADKQAIKDSRDGLRYDIEGREIERLRLVNRGDLADARQAELELAKQIAALEKDSTLSAGERAAAGAILTAQSHELADIGAKNRAEAARAVSSTRTMNAAAGNAGIFEQVFTAASANTSEPLAVARRSEAYLKRMTDLMSQIAGQAGGVVFQ